MFGVTPRCPTCEKLVYAAEQILGPGRKFYHKPCLTCTSCKRRLDSYTLLEHDEQPFCKPCHVKNFGTRDLRQANLPYAPPPEDAPSPRPAPLDTSLPVLRPTRVLSPTSSNFPRPLSRPGSSGAGPPPTLPPRRSFVIKEEPQADINADADTSLESESQESNVSVTTVSTDPTSAAADDEADEFKVVSSSPGKPKSNAIPTNTGRPGLGNMPRTVPLSFDHSSHVSSSSSPSSSTRHKTTQSLGRINVSLTPQSSSSSYSYSSPPFSPTNRAAPAAAALSLLQQEGLSPLRQTPTGTRYGVALGGSPNPMSIGVQMTGTPGRRWGGTTPVCPKCSKSVYFAEQVKAVGKTYHKYCLRCTECNTTLDSTKLRDHDEQPFCVRCYNKLHGPQGHGYALLGKAGG